MPEGQQRQSSWLPLLVGAGIVGTTVTLGAACGAYFLYQRGLETERRARQGLQDEIKALRMQARASSKSLKVERANWLNHTLRVMWPSLKKAIRTSTMATLEPLIRESCPSFLSSLRLVNFDMGQDEPILGGVRFHDTGEEMVQFDLVVESTGNCEIVVEVGLRGSTFLVTLEELTIKGDIEVVLKPLVPVWPCFSAMSVAFTSRPAINYTLNAGYVSLSAIPGFEAWLTDFVETQLACYMVLPKRLLLPILDIDPEEIAEMQSFSKRPKGLLRVQVVCALSLKKANLISKADPYVKLSIDDVSQKTSIRTNTLTPHWGEDFEFVVSDPSREFLRIAVFDYNKIGKDKAMGHSQILLTDLEEGSRDYTVQLPEGSGTVKLILQWSPIKRIAEDAVLPPSSTAQASIPAQPMPTAQPTNSSPSSAAASASTLAPSSSSSSLVSPTGALPSAANLLPSTSDLDLSAVAGHAGILSIAVVEAQGLPSMDRFSKKADPYAIVTLGKTHHKTPHCARTLAPSWVDQQFQIPFKDLGLAVVTVEVRDWNRTGSKHIGSVAIPLASVVGSGGRRDEWFELQAQASGPVKGKIFLRLSVKTL